MFRIDVIVSFCIEYERVGATRSITMATCARSARSRKEACMRGNDKVIAELNEALREELTAINQYFIHAEMCHNWGYHRLGSYIRKQSIDEMKHAEVLIERILFLDGDAEDGVSRSEHRPERACPDRGRPQARGQRGCDVQQGDSSGAQRRRRSVARAVLEAAQGRGRARGLARGAAPHDQGDGLRAVPVRSRPKGRTSRIKCSQGHKAGSHRSLR